MTSSDFNSQVLNHKKDELNSYKHSSVSLIFSFTFLYKSRKLGMRCMGFALITCDGMTLSIDFFLIYLWFFKGSSPTRTLFFWQPRLRWWCLTIWTTSSSSFSSILRLGGPESDGLWHRVHSPFSPRFLANTTESLAEQRKLQGQPGSRNKVSKPILRLYF